MADRPEGERKEEEKRGKGFKALRAMERIFRRISWNLRRGESEGHGRFISSMM